MTFELFILLGVVSSLVVYIVLRLAYVYFSGKDYGQNYHEDSEK